MNEQEQLLDVYNNLDISQKRKQIAEEVTELLLVIKKLQKDMQIESDVDNNADLKKLYDGLKSEDEYLTVLYSNIIKMFLIIIISIFISKFIVMKILFNNKR